MIASAQNTHLITEDHPGSTRELLGGHDTVLYRMGGGGRGGGGGGGGGGERSLNKHEVLISTRL